MNLSEVLSVMEWPLIACLLLPGLLVYLGMHIVHRGIIFVDLALAQMAALGASVAILFGWDAGSVSAYCCSTVFTLMGAVIFTHTRSVDDERVPQEALIGIVYVVAAASGMLLLSGTPEGNEELRRSLIGDLLLVSAGQVWRTFALFVSVALVHYYFRRQFFAVTFAPERASNEGISLKRWDFLFYVLFGIVVTSFVQIAGVLLVFSYLIVPAIAANFLSRRPMAILCIGWILATVCGVSGLAGSYLWDVPTGAAIVCSFGLGLGLVMLYAKLNNINALNGSLSST
ncbi:MAG: iron chelate uptake ABC transporter family permease subunit [Bdellovibrionota bacterium]